jgi:hypothetical protein
MPAGNTYEAIAEQTLGSAAASVTFSSISGAYTDLILQVNNQMSGASGFKIRFNSDSGTNYSETSLLGYAGSANSGRASSATSIYNNLVYGDSTTSSVFTPNIIQIQNYSNTTTNKTLLWRYGTTTSAGGNGEVGAIVGLWRSTSAINAIEISAWNAVNFVAGSTFSLYGIASA